jgi:hypothetical protein
MSMICPSGQLAKGKARKVAPLGLKLDYGTYLYYLDSKLNVMRAKRAKR